jgi:two-component system, response regulator, stage 0 sporulation protein F
MEVERRLGAALALTFPVKPAPIHTLLVAEDDPDLRETLCDALTTRWTRVTAVGSGREAMDCLRFDPAPAGIVLDLRLPDVDGWELLRWLRDQQALRHVPVVIVSGAPFEHVELALGHPSVTYLRKPVGLSDLSDAIRNAVGASCDERA